MRTVFLIGVIAGAVVLAQGCATTPAAPPSSIGGSDAADYLIVATAGPLTGVDAVFGEQLKRGAELAIADINAAGGLLGKKLKLELGDDQCEPKQALPVANAFVRKKVVFVAGHYCSGVSIPASAVYAENNILMITPAASNPRLTDEAKAKGWTTVFRTCGRDDMQGAVAGKYLASTFQGRKIAILHDRTPYGQGTADATKRNMNAAGLREVLYDSFRKGDKDFTALVGRMKEMGVEIVYVGSYHAEVGLLVKQAREQGLGAQFVSEDALVTDEFWKVSGPAGEGLLMTFLADAMANPNAKPVVDRFLRAGYKPEGYTLYTYAAFQVYAAAVKAANSLDAREVATQIRGKAIDTVLGRLEYDEKGDVTNTEYVWYKWHDGRYARIRL
jgi:branched-chain amino acid transport system substrate-binding protein